MVAGAGGVVGGGAFRAGGEALPGRRASGKYCRLPSLGHSACYISPYGDVYPCVQFPLPSGNVRKQKFLEIWRNSAELNEVRSIRARDLPTCSHCSHVGTCTRCPGLAYMEGSMLGPSSADCEKSFHRTGIPSANMLRKAGMAHSGPLIQIQAPFSSN